MKALTLPGTVTPPTSLAELVGRAGAARLTRVSLAYIEQRIDIYLRFGEPARTIRLDRWRRVAVFLPGAMFCRIRWQANDYGTVRWQLMVMQACTPLDAAQRIPGVLPGARLLLQQVLRLLREILEQLLDARYVIGGLSERAGELLDRRIAVELQRIEVTAVAGLVLVTVQDLRLGFDFEVAQLLLQTGHGA